MRVEFPILMNGKCIKVTEEVETVADAFEFIATLQEVFTGLECTRNGKSSDNVTLRVREKDGNKFYEAVCMDRDDDLYMAKKRFGQHKKPKGSIFPQNKDNEGNRLPNNGWVKYNKKTGKEE